MKLELEISRRIREEDPREFFIRRLAEGVGRIAAAFYPKPVIVRMSDFKSNEYAQLIGGREFEPVEENPMLGFRGASRYYDDRYREGFGLECKAFVRVREEMGLTNVKAMIPFCRTVEEARRVIQLMTKYGLRQGEQGLEIYAMCELPANVIYAFLQVARMDRRLLKELVAHTGHSSQLFYLANDRNAQFLETVARSGFVSTTKNWTIEK